MTHARRRRPRGKSAESLDQPEDGARACRGRHGNALGAFGANQHLRQSLVFLDMPALQQPEMYIGGAAKLFDPDGRLVNDDTRALLKKFVDAFAVWIEKTRQA
jgi:NAD(P)H-dependent FMN reductase